MKFKKIKEKKIEVRPIEGRRSQYIPPWHTSYFKSKSQVPTKRKRPCDLKSATCLLSRLYLAKCRRHEGVRGPHPLPTIRKSGFWTSSRSQCAVEIKSMSQLSNWTYSWAAMKISSWPRPDKALVFRCSLLATLSSSIIRRQSFGLRLGRPKRTAGCRNKRYCGTWAVVAGVDVEVSASFLSYQGKK